MFYNFHDTQFKNIVEPTAWPNVLPLGPLCALPCTGPFANLCVMLTYTFIVAFGFTSSAPPPQRCLWSPLTSSHRPLRKHTFFHLLDFLTAVNIIKFRLRCQFKGNTFFHLHDYLTAVKGINFRLRCQFKVKARMSHKCFGMLENVY